MPNARKMLSDWDAPYIQALVRLIETQSKSTLAHWSVAYDALGTKASWADPEVFAAEEGVRMLDALRAVSVENEPNPARIDWKC
ncbi:MAG: hypothetical protein JW780_04425 [Clostridiales bacterium]|nr:hypothetical protein [Clostridiales bacterium]